MSADHTLPILVCFAVKEEARFFEPDNVPGESGTLITGMGRANASRAVREALAGRRPGLVVTAGFAGGLRPGLQTGAVLFDEDAAAGLTTTLLEAGAAAGRFHCAERVAVTAAEKAALRAATGADAVEMESGVIRQICRDQGIPAVTVRVISDPADEDLPLDFNALMTAGQRIDFVKLARTLLLSPGKMPRLIAFQKQTSAAARELGRVLHRSLGGPGR